jgi:hypothetical protein
MRQKEIFLIKQSMYVYFKYTKEMNIFMFKTNIIDVCFNNFFYLPKKKIKIIFLYIFLFINYYLAFIYLFIYLVLIYLLNYSKNFFSSPRLSIDPWTSFL